MISLEWVAVSAGPTGAVVGMLIKEAFDRRFKKTNESKTRTESAKIDADAAEVITQVALALVTPLKEEIAELRVRVEQLESENARTTGKLRRAVTYIKELRFFIELHLPNERIPQPPLDIEL